MMVMFGSIATVFILGTYIGSSLVPYYKDSSSSHLESIRGDMKVSLLFIINIMPQ